MGRLHWSDVHEGSRPPLRTMLINEERDFVVWPPVPCPASPFFLTTSEVGAELTEFVAWGSPLPGQQWTPVID